MKIRNRERLRSAAYLRNPEPVCVVREMRDAPSNEFVAMHDHEFSELVIVATGGCNHVHAGGTVRLLPGEFFVIHPGERHGYAQFAPGTLVFNLLYDRCSPPAPLLLEDNPLTPMLFPSDAATARADTLGRVPRRALPNLVRLLKALRREAEAHQPLCHAVSSNLFAAVLLVLARWTRGVAAKPASPVKREVDFILRNLGRKITLAELCAVSGRSASALHREFRKAVGASPGDYILSLRAARARELLAQTSLPLAAVAAETGFCNASHLVRTLRAHRMGEVNPIRRAKIHE